MKILLSWLRDLVDVTVSPEELGQALTLRGFELSSLQTMDDGRWTMDDGRSTMDDGRSTMDDGRPTMDDGRWTMDDDAVLDFEVTANRPDALSVIGFAREAATIYSLAVRAPALKTLPKSGSSDVAVTLEDPELCPRYAAAVADVAIGPSPPWLSARLHAAGVRPINNVVDVTNYVLIELGQPMHAFDLEKLDGRQIRIRRAAGGERIRTLDGTERTLDPEMLVIADASRPQAIAGVMGGGLSEVSSETRTIVLESAFFNPRSVRRTSKRLGLKTEASARFERGADVGIPVTALERAIALLEQIGAGRSRGAVIDQYPIAASPKQLRLRRTQILRVLGLEIPDHDAERILSHLGFTVRPDSAGWDVTVPTFRVDVSREIDLIEEIARHYGYDRLPSTFPALTQPTPPSDPRIERDRLVRRILMAGGCTETFSFSFIDRASAAHFAEAAAIVPIDNPLTSQFAVLRPSLLPGLLASLAHNRNRERVDIRLFELGAIVTREGESRRVAIVWTGDANGSHWSGARRLVDFFDLKGLVELLAKALQVEIAFDAEPLPAHVVRGRGATLSVAGRSLGVVGLLTPAVVSAAGISASDDVYAAELDLDTLSASRQTTMDDGRSTMDDGRWTIDDALPVKPLPRYPSISRDISIIVDEVLPAATIRGTIRSVAPDTLVSVREFDRYQGKGVPEQRVSLSLRLTFRSSERTLTDAEVQKAMDAILTALVNSHQAVQR